MFLEEAVAYSIKKHPILYRDVDYKKSRIKVLNQFFNVIGNGQKWFDGYCAEIKFRRKNGEYERYFLPYGKERCSPKFRKDYFISDNIIGMFKTKRDKKYNHVMGLTWENEDNRYPFRPYPISSDFSLITQIPSDVRSDWLEGANEICQIGLYFFNNPQCFKHDTFFKELGGENNSPNWIKYLESQQKMYSKVFRKIKKLLAAQNLPFVEYSMPDWNWNIYE